jgi:5-methylthioadenosine/S-adenosylhomocysteine deaminase
VRPVATGGTIYPGLIELHNHLPYDILRLWQVPKRFTNRDQWRADTVPDYRKLISGPMGVLGRSDAVPAIVRYVEAKCLVAGTTTSQGVRLSSAPGIPSYFRGVVRNVETPGDSLPVAGTHVQDVAASDATAFLTELDHGTCLLLHLAEGTDTSAHQHFAALQIAPGEWAIRPSLAGIHCAALTADDFATLARQGGAMVWSPLSNLLLYGQTADMAAATSTPTALRIGLGADWSPSGSKNLLGELKVAKLCSDDHAAQHGAPLFTDVELLALATRNAAAILGWKGKLGVIAADALADLLVIAGRSGDPYAALLHAGEQDIRVVVIGGHARYGTPGLLTALGATISEQIRIGGRTRALDLSDPTSHPQVDALSLAAARAKLSEALGKLPELARAQEQGQPHPLLAATGTQPLELVLDEIEDTGFEQRPRLPFHGHLTGPDLIAAAAAPPLSTILGPLTLDRLTVADDSGWLAAIEQQTNLPASVRNGLRGLYP